MSRTSIPAPPAVRGPVDPILAAFVAAVAAVGAATKAGVLQPETALIAAVFLLALMGMGFAIRWMDKERRRDRKRCDEDLTAVRERCDEDITHLREDFGKSIEALRSEHREERARCEDDLRRHREAIADLSADREKRLKVERDISNEVRRLAERVVELAEARRAT